jgi:hypothetical protein
MSDINNPVDPEMPIYAEFVAALIKPGDTMKNEMSPEQMNALHMAVGIAGEAGETLSCIVIDPNDLDAEIDLVNLVEELGDIEFYAEGLRAALDISYVETQVYGPVAETMPIIPLIAATSLSIAAANILDAVKKWTVYQKPIARDVVVDELRSLELAMAWLRFGFDLSREVIILGNYSKLGKRYASLSYSNEAAIIRADKG